MNEGKRNKSARIDSVRIWKTSIIKSKIYKKKIEDPITTKKQVPNKIAIYHHIP